MYMLVPKEWPGSPLCQTFPLLDRFSAILKILIVTVYPHFTQNNLILTCSVKIFQKR